jgi:NIMA-interacting peptidyl-prolyl cis-trans isomerase 1
LLSSFTDPSFFASSHHHTINIMSDTNPTSTLSASDDAGLPADWEVRHSRSKNLPYYFNTVAKESRWEPPEGTDTEKLKTYMAKHHTAALTQLQAAPTSAAAAAAPSETTAAAPAAATQQQQTAGGGSTRPDGKIRAAHLLVKHANSRRPASWKEAQITRTEDEALAIIQQHEARIRDGEVGLGALAVSESDCSSARKYGDLGYFGRGDMQKEFEDAAFALGPGEISGVVKTASGLHLIERLE